jgi:MinD superfamily P-loop ATPase
MRQLAVLSGKGGTGKTSVVAVLAHLASQEARVVLVDADVDAANLKLVLAPEKLESHDFVGGKVAFIDKTRCNACGLCQELCRFEAVSSLGISYRVDPVACEGCASCFHQCPSQAIRMREQVAGRWLRSDTRFGPLLHAHLFPGGENSGKLVTLVKRHARDLALDECRDYLLIDGPPGIGCPAIAACAQADLVLLIAEPTVAGVHDLERAIALTGHFGVQTVVCINKCDINEARAGEIERFCTSRDVAVVGRIPFDTAVTGAMVQGRAVSEVADGRLAQELRRVWRGAKGALDGNRQPIGAGEDRDPYSESGG